MVEASELGTLLDKIDEQLDEDLNFYSYGTKSINVKTKNLAETRTKFARYLISVASHPIGLRASISPFNCDQELMLIYLMNMLKLSEAHVKKILGVSEGGSKSPKPIKRHPWRPELRIRLDSPKFYRDEETYLENLSARVYLCRHVEPMKDSHQLGLATAKNRNPFKLLHKMRMDESMRIQPVSEMKYLIKFSKVQKGSTNSAYKMNYSTGKDHRSIEDDIFFRIRRSDCELALGVIRFEFWIDISRLTKLQRIKHFAKHLICSNGYCCAPRGRTSDGEDFYGAANIKLSQVPSYASKKSYPIVALNGSRVNNCEISIEAKNRRLLDDDGTRANTKLPANDKPKQSSFRFILAHLRLYVNCILYQLSTLDDSALIVSESYQSDITLDNILYIPAYTLINQHRLQANLNQLEDQSIRRVAMLLLLLKLDTSRAKTVRDLEISSMKSVLLSLVHNEYLFAQRPIDDKTLQEIDPFNEDQVDNVRGLVVNLEIASLGVVVNNFLASRLRKWFMREQALKSYQKEINPERHLTLRTLKLMQIITSQFRKSSLVSMKLKRQAIELSEKINTIISEIIVEEVTNRMQKIVAWNEKPKASTTIRKTLTAGRTNASATNSKGANLWRRLLYDVRFINRDMVLYWSKKGLGSLQFDEKRIRDKMNLADKSNKSNLRSVIEMEMQCFLAD